MQIIVKESGFYGGTWFEAKPGPQEMHPKIAAPFLPPHGHQLALPEEKPAAKPGKPAEPKAD